MPPTRSGLPPNPHAWPGLESGGPDLVVGDLKALARKLESQLEAMLSTTTGHLQKAGAVPPSAYGQWDAAAQLAGTATTAHAAIADHHLRFIHSLQAVVKKLYESANVYNEHESAIEAKVRQLDQLLTRGSAVPPTGTPPSRTLASGPSRPESGTGPTWPEAGQ